MASSAALSVAMSCIASMSNVIGMAPGVRNYSTMNLLMLPGRTVFIADTYVNYDPSAEQLADMTLEAAEEIRRFGIAPKVALLVAFVVRYRKYADPQKMREVLRLLNERAPRLEVEGEMHGDAALDESIRNQTFPNSRLKGTGQPAGDADARCRQHLLQSAQGGGGR